MLHPRQFLDSLVVGPQVSLRNSTLAGAQAALTILIALPWFYYVSPWRIKNLILFLSSLVFYAWGEPVYIVIMLLSTITDYSFGLLLSRPKLTAVQRKWIVVSSVIINLGLLSYFKYADFLIQNINGLLGTHIPLTA